MRKTASWHEIRAVFWIIHYVEVAEVFTRYSKCIVQNDLLLRFICETVNQHSYNRRSYIELRFVTSWDCAECGLLSPWCNCVEMHGNARGCLACEFVELRRNRGFNCMGMCGTTASKCMGLCGYATHKMRGNARSRGLCRKLRVCPQTAPGPIISPYFLLVGLLLQYVALF